MRYFAPFGGPDGREQGTMFSTDRCETCGRTVQQPNAVTIFPKPGQLEKLGIRTWEKPLPPEIWWDEDLEQTVCDRADCKEHAGDGEEERF